MLLAPKDYYGLVHENAISKNPTGWMVEVYTECTENTDVPLNRSDHIGASMDETE